MNITFFFRKPNSQFHSIEQLFASIEKYLPNEFEIKNFYLPYHNGLWGRIKNVFIAKRNQSQLNHITGDVNYIALGLPKKNTILTIHDVGSALVGNIIKRKIIIFFWFKLPLKKVAKITVVSEFSKNEIIKTFGIKSEKIIVIPDCIADSFNYSQRKFNNLKPNILFIGTKSNKNLDNAAKAISKINCNLTILGKLSEQQKTLLENLQINFETFFDLEQSKVIELYKNADLLLFPSIYEGFGMPIIEAQSCGLPVITSNLEPMKTVAGDAAILVNPYKVDEIEKAVTEIIQNEQLRSKLIANGLENAKKYSASEIAKKYAYLYKSLI